VISGCAEPNCTAAAGSNTPRCGQGHMLRHCPNCGTANRAFANVCRDCAAQLPSLSSWTGHKGGPRRLGVNATPGPVDWTSRKALSFSLGDACRTLLACDGHLVAVSMNGTIWIADPTRERVLCRFQTQGPMTAEPCISNGTLHVATHGRVTAYALGPTALEPPRIRPLWQADVAGTPIFALTPAGNRLYVTIQTGNQHEVHVIERPGHGSQAVARRLQGARKTSWLSADPASGNAIFLSEDDGHVQLHVAAGDIESHPVHLDTLHEQPVAVLSGSVFAIFGRERRLVRINSATGAIEEPLDSDTLLFALTHDANFDWDRDGVRIDGEGACFLRSAIRDSFTPQDRATKPSPVVVQGAAAAVGMEDGRVLLYRLAHLPRHEVWRIDGGAAAPITALASFDGFIAAGDRDGAVEVRELRPGGAA